MPIPAITPVVAPAGGDLHSLTPYDAVVVVASSFIGGDIPYFQDELAVVSKVK
jgi:hypothetical protein